MTALVPLKAYIRLYWSIVLLLVGLHTSMRAEKIEIKNWRYTPADSLQWRPCVVPSMVQGNLIKDGLLPHPHYRLNEQLVQGVEDRDWVYEADIDLPEALPLSQDGTYLLRLGGIDTYSTIRLNGYEIGKTNNMFVGYEYDLTPYLQRGHNTLSIHLHAPLKVAHPLYEKAGINYPADNDHAEIHYSVFTRKAPYSYGWDWGMRLVTMGIWQPISLTYYRGAHIEDLDVKTSIQWQGKTSVPKGATIEVIPRHSASRRVLSYRLSLLDEHNHKVSEAVAPALGTDSLTAIRIQLRQPKLWNPKGWGKPYLYTLYTELLDATGKVLDTDSRQIGLRELRFRREVDEYGTSFAFEVNRQPFFAKGANYIPGENILTNRDDATFRRLFDDVEFANMNMLRVWGGGVYEDDRFYREADRRGIMIWQDFMFACTSYPADDEFLSSVVDEVRYQVKRLRHHPSIALWCGNNEVEEGLKYWGWKSRYTEEQYSRMWSGYERLFRELIPRELERLDSTRSYIHSSPESANWGRPETWLHSDVHYWGLWYGKAPFESVDSLPMRFASEFGFQSFPDEYALKQFADKEDMSLESAVMRQHQKASTGNGLIREYMSREYPVPYKFTDFVYVGQILQARGMEHLIRTLRRHRPICMGSLYWQLNDSWPSVSWSSIDYYQNYKALHYSVRRAYAPLCLLPEWSVGDKQLKLYLANDYLEKLGNVRLKVSVKDFEGRVLHRELHHLKPAKANATSYLTSIEVGQWISPDSYIDLELTTDHGETHLRWYGLKTKNLNLPEPKYQLSVQKQSDGYRVSIKAESYIKDAFLDVPLMGARWSDNLFDLSKGEERILMLYLPDGPHISPQDVRLRSMGSINN